MVEQMSISKRVDFTIQCNSMDPPQEMKLHKSQDRAAYNCCYNTKDTEKKSFNMNSQSKI